MLPLASYDIVFQEVPGEVSLALNIAGCPNGCPGCHSAHLQEDKGEVLDEDLLAGLLETYGPAITCVCFMGGDGEPAGIAALAGLCRSVYGLKTAWYSGCNEVPGGVDALRLFDYIKLGPYREDLGGLDSPATNQRFYRVADGCMEDVTYLFRKV